LPCQRFDKPKVGRKHCHRFWQAKRESLASFGSKPNTSQNHSLPNHWHDKFWKRTNQALNPNMSGPTPKGMMEFFALA
jgi:hypothetical protein